MKESKKRISQPQAEEVYNTIRQTYKTAVKLPKIDFFAIYADRKTMTVGELLQEIQIEIDAANE